MVRLTNRVLANRTRHDPRCLAYINSELYIFPLTVYNRTLLYRTSRGIGIYFGIAEIRHSEFPSVSISYMSLGWDQTFTSIKLELRYNDVRLLSLCF